jgi:enoyl-CoA hydratase
VSVQQTLQAIDRVLDVSDDDGWSATARGVTNVMASDDMKEGVQAFLEKREPRWTGR